MANTRHKSKQIERDLEQKSQELATLKNLLCQKERVKLNLQWETTDFKKIYTDSLSPRLEELDRLKKQLEILQGGSDPENPTTSDTDEEFTLKQNYEDDRKMQDLSDGQMASDAFPNIKELYRKVAKTIHPDLSTNDDERKWRQKLMAEANNAYANEDGESLQSILHQWVTGHNPGISSGISAELTHLTHRIFQVRVQLRAVEAEIDQLKNSDLYRLMIRIDEALYDGVDLLAEIASSIDDEIASIWRHLSEAYGIKTSHDFNASSAEVGGRTVCFPSDRSMGILFLRKDGSDSFLDWYRYGEAIGRVTIPAGKSLRLDVPESSGNSLSPLQKLQSNDLQALFLHRAEDGELPNIHGLAGLAELYLSGSGITNSGLAIIRELQGLHRLYLYDTMVTDTGLGALKQMRSLSYLTLSGSKVTETGLNLLRETLPGCRVSLLQSRGKRQSA
jgi:hypothetical protein